jgi:hypothetical protein
MLVHLQAGFIECSRDSQQKNEYVTGSEIKLRLTFNSKHYKYNSIILPINVFDKYKRRLIASTTITTTYKSSFLNDISKSINDDLDECEQFFKIKCKRLNEIHERVVKRDKSELERQRESDKDAPEVCFVDETLKLLEEIKNGLLNEINEEEAERKQRLTSNLPIEIKSNANNNITSVSDKLE